MTSPRKTPRFSFIWLSTLTLAAATTAASAGCSGDDPGGSSTEGGGTSQTSAGSGGASSASAGSTSASGTGSSTTAGTGGTGSTSDASSAASTGSGNPSGECPQDATFCSGFEEAGIPAGATYRPSYMANDWAKYMAIDSAVTHAGSQSLQVKPGGSGYDWRMLSVPAPGPTFWVRLYVRSDADIGQAEHNAYFQAMTGDGDPNVGDNMEVAEQYCQIVLNLHDAVVLSKGGQTMCGSGGIKLPKDTWHCMEAYFDGTKGDVQVYANGEQIIDKAGWTQLAYKTFSFGFLSFHGPARTMWYDDVAVASERIGCAP